jgi:aspartyl/glutamyl-tRNA(Asn/Gln) amidotransferase C subunit
MVITLDDKVAFLKRMVKEAYLELPPDHADRLAREAAEILDNVDVLASLPVEAAPPGEGVEPSDLRADEISPPLTVAAALANAPASHHGFVSVPKVIPADGREDEV